MTEYLSENAEAINILRENKDNIVWEYLSKNTAAIDLLINRIKEESKMSQEEYYKLETEERINYKYLAENSAMLVFLQKKYNKSFY
jgi:hypothetical protein